MNKEVHFIEVKHSLGDTQYLKVLLGLERAYRICMLFWPCAIPLQGRIWCTSPCPITHITQTERLSAVATILLN